MKLRRAYVMAVLMLALFSVSFVAGAIGTGVLEVLGVSPNPQGQYDVVPGNTYTIRVSGITEINPYDGVIVKICWTAEDGTPQTTVFSGGDVAISGSGPWSVEVVWEIPSNAKLSTTSTVHYRAPPPQEPEYLASGQMRPVGHMHHIPEVPFGAVAPLAAGLCALALLKRKQP